MEVLRLELVKGLFVVKLVRILVAEVKDSPFD